MPGYFTNHPLLDIGSGIMMIAKICLSPRLFVLGVLSAYPGSTPFEAAIMGLTLVGIRTISIPTLPP